MNVFERISQKLDAGESFVLATIIRTAGSTPRDAGAKMLVYPDGSISGTIGGGKFEKLVIDDCLGMFESKSPNLLKSYEFTEDGKNATAMCCGGKADVFMELFGKLSKLLIFGGGHIGKNLAGIAGELNFKITVIDDRREILNQYGAPVNTILTDQCYEKNFPSLDQDSYVVIVTHGHKHDESILEKVLKHDCAYIGMIGSKSKIAKVFSQLRKSGITQAVLDKVHAPIGVDIGAEGPYEIAIAIAAELIVTKRKVKGN